MFDCRELIGLLWQQWTPYGGMSGNPRKMQTFVPLRGSSEPPDGFGAVMVLKAECLFGTFKLQLLMRTSESILCPSVHPHARLRKNVWGGGIYEDDPGRWDRLRPHHHPTVPLMDKAAEDQWRDQRSGSDDMKVVGSHPNLCGFLPKSLSTIWPPK